MHSSGNAIVLRTIFVYIAAMLMTIAVVLFILAILIVENGFKDGQVLSWDAPMPWAIILAMTGTAVLLAVRRMPIATELSRIK
jgi:hypothetical protein